MADVVICDTNAVIQLAIICPNVLTKKNEKIRFVVHTKVKQEVHNLKTDAEKNARLGNILELILKQVPTDATCTYPNQRDEIVHHKRIQKFEDSIPDLQKSAGSSHQDRCFLILAKTNKAYLLTNEHTLYALGTALLGSEVTWRISDAVENILSQEIASQQEIQNGLNELEKYQENLRTDCADKIRKLGFQYE